MLSIKPNATHVPEEIKNKVLLPKTKLRSDTKTLMVINQYVAVLANIYVTVEPVLSGHPLLSGQLSKSRKLLPLITVILTSIKRSPLLSGRGHPLLSPDELFILS